MMVGLLCSPMAKWIFVFKQAVRIKKLDILETNCYKNKLVSIARNDHICDLTHFYSLYGKLGLLNQVSCISDSL